jgi:HD-GYP domain-containing protein (c-di-GMP phosphodiesterase class II)
MSSIISLASDINRRFDLPNVGLEGINMIRAGIKAEKGKLYCSEALDAFEHVLTGRLLRDLRSDVIMLTYETFMPKWNYEMSSDNLLHGSNFVAQLVGAQSPYTVAHSIQVANIVWQMLHRNKMSRMFCAQVYLAASAHDVGKLAVPASILEKKGALTSDEMSVIRIHPTVTNGIMNITSGFERIKDWAGNHHERLDGSGYGRGLKGADLDEISRLIAVADVYEASSSSRPYHDSRNRSDVEDIVFGEVKAGKLDSGIAYDVCDMMRDYDLGNVPGPTSHMVKYKDAYGSAFDEDLVAQLA